MFPPTPTALPAPGAAPVVINAANYRIWKFVDEAIMLWQQGQRYSLGTVIQVSIILIIVIFFIWYLIQLAQSLTNEGDL